MKVRDWIWYELMDEKYAEIWLCNRLHNKKEWLRWYKVVTIGISAGGVLSWKIWETLPIIFLSIQAALQVFTTIEGHIIPSNDEIVNTEKLRMSHYKKFLLLQALWVELESGMVEEIDAVKRLNDIRQMDLEIEDLDNKYKISPSKRAELEADQKTIEFFNRLRNEQRKAKRTRRKLLKKD